MSVQQTFSLTVSSKVKTVHVIGTWDAYKGQLPLSRGSKPGKWAASFKFPVEKMKPGGTHWYYYMIDGHHITHDPSEPFIKEKTQGRMMNKLVVEGRSSEASKRSSTQPIKGRAISPSRIVHPKPSKPYASRGIREADYSKSPGVDDLADKLEQASLYKMRRDISPPSSVGSSLSSRSRGGFSDRSSPSSLSSLSDRSSSDGSSTCNYSCNLMATYRNGEKRRVSCNGELCGSSSDEDSCSSIEDSSESEEEVSRHRSSKSYSSSKPAARYVEARPKQGGVTYSSRRKY